MNSTSVERPRAPMIVVTPALPPRHSLPIEMQEALNSIIQSSTNSQHLDGRVKKVDGVEHPVKGVAGDKGSSWRGHRKEHCTHSRPPRAAKPAHLGKGFKDGEASRVHELAGLQLVGREDEAGWLDRVIDQRKTRLRCISNESATTLVGDANEDSVASAVNTRQSRGDHGHNRVGREQVEDTRRHAWYVSAPDWPKFNDKPTLLERAKNATRTISFGKKA